MNTLTLELSIPEEQSKIIIDSVNLEAEKDFHSRSKVKLSYGKGILTILIEAQDLPAMRAAVNTYLRWVIMCEKLINDKK